MTKVNDNNRQIMIHKYAQNIVESMDQETLRFYAHIGVMEDFKFHTNENLESEISRFYPSIFLEKNNEQIQSNIG